MQELKASNHLTAASVDPVHNTLCTATGRHGGNWDNIIGGFTSTAGEPLPMSMRNPGMIVVWDPWPGNSFGHVAFVEEVNAAKTQYRISEYNWGVSLSYTSSVWLPFDGNDTRGTGNYPKFYPLGLIYSPVPQFPISGTTTIPVSFGWMGPNGAEYRIQVSTSNSGWTSQNGFTSSTTACGGSLVVNKNVQTNSGFTWNSIEPGVCAAPQPNTTYYWTVKAYTPTGGNSLWSPVSTFSTLSSNTCVAPTTGQMNHSNVTASSAIISTSASGTLYQFRRRPLNTSSWTNSAQLTSNNWATSGLLANTTYEYQGAVRCANGVWSTWSASKTFTTLGNTCAAPTTAQMNHSSVTSTSATLSNSATGTAVQFRWKALNTTSWTTSAQLSANTTPASGLLANTTYEYQGAVRCANGVWSTWSASKTFTTTSLSTTPLNDNPCSATTIIAGSGCTYSSGTNVGATNTTNPGAPTSCPYYPYDVWFKVQVPSTGIITIRTWAGTLTDALMAVYYGSCTALQGIVCEDDNNQPGGNSSLMPVITITGYSPGTWLHIRIWGYGNATGTFQICAMNYSTLNLADSGNPEGIQLTKEQNVVEASVSWSFHPNPTSGVLYGSFQLESDASVELNLRDLSGRVIRRLVREQMNAGVASLQFDLTDLPSGPYFIQGIVGRETVAERIIIVR
ncbi:MAG: CHAP domain-containing protein [Saprospiraceae bacterium]|nr:CHAP domain-containing protein [Saprospiraceae bacterium]